MKPPAHLGKDGRLLFEQLVSEFGIADVGGLTLVTVAAECRDRMMEAQASIKQFGAVIVTPSGNLRPNPALKVEVDARNGLLAVLRALNLDLEPLRDQLGRPAGTSRPRAA